MFASRLAHLTDSRDECVHNRVGVWIRQRKATEFVLEFCLRIKRRSGDKTWRNGCVINLDLLLTDCQGTMSWNRLITVRKRTRRSGDAKRAGWARVGMLTLNHDNLLATDGRGAGARRLRRCTPTHAGGKARRSTVVDAGGGERRASCSLLDTAGALRTGYGRGPSRRGRA